MADHPTETAVSDVSVQELLMPSKIEEGQESYRPGGFHPVRIGEVYNGVYKVILKLGYGTYSTVWLVKREQDQTYWAMKVLSAEAYGAGEDIHELEILQHLRDSNPDHAGYDYISLLQDSFDHEGPNGKHICLIFKVMGETLDSFVWWFDGRPPTPLIRNFTNQLLYALDYANSCGIIHTDIQPANIMVQLPDESLLTECLGDTPDQTQTMTLGAEYQIIESSSLREIYLPEAFNLIKLKIALSDWGVARWSNKHSSPLIQPVALRSPQVLLGAPWDISTDFWNLGAVIPELLYSQCMFSGRTEEGEYKRERHLEEIYNLFGSFPRSLLDKGDKDLVTRCFDGEGRILDPVVPTIGLEVRFGDMEGEMAEFISFIKAMLTIDPKKRMSPKALLETDWALHDLKVVDDEDGGSEDKVAEEHKAGEKPHDTTVEV